MSNEKRLEKYSPATDIVESDQGFYMYMDLPGVKHEDLVIDLEENTLVVSAKTGAAISEDEKYIDREFTEGECSRRFTIADVVDRENIKASLKNGVLELFLPKMQEVQPRKIQITAE